MGNRDGVAVPAEIDRRDVDPARRKREGRFEELPIGFGLQLRTLRNVRRSVRSRTVDAHDLGARSVDDPKLIVRALRFQLGQIAGGHPLAPVFLGRAVDRVGAARQVSAKDAFQRHRGPEAQNVVAGAARVAFKLGGQQPGVAVDALQRPRPGRRLEDCGSSGR